MALIRRIAVNFVLIAIFILLAIVIIAPFLAEIEFANAKNLSDAGQRESAEKAFDNAIRLDPFDSRYLYGFAEHLSRIGSGSADKIDLLKKAEALCARASALNPHSAAHAVLSGQIQLDIDKNNIDAAFGHFATALKYDPNGFNTAYAIGYAGMTVWNDLDDAKRKLVIDRLRYSLVVRPLYYDVIYRLIWQKTINFKYLKEATADNLKSNEYLYDFIKYNNLWQFRKIQEDALAVYMEKEKPETLKADRRQKSERISKIKEAIAQPSSVGTVVLSDNWRGKAAYGNSDYIDGNMYWAGTIDAAIHLPRGRSRLTIEAKGSQAYGIYPYMIVELDGEEVAEVFVASREWKKYDFTVNGDGGIKVLSVTFTNDAIDTRKNTDRNLYIGKAEIKDVADK